MAAEGARLNKGKKGGAAGGNAGAGAGTATAGRTTKFTDAERDAATREVYASIGNHYARKKNKGNTYFSNPGVIGYVIRNTVTGDLKALSRREAVFLSVKQAETFKSGNAETVLFYKNAIHDSSESEVKVKTELPGGGFQEVVQKDENGEPVKKVSLRLRGINGLSLLNEKMLADGRALPKNDHYSSPELAQKAFDMYQDILEGRIPATPELLAAMQEAKTSTTRGGGKGAKSGSKTVLDDLDSFMSKAAEAFADVQMVEI